MNLREALTAAAEKIEDDQLPASEISREIRSILNDETLSDGCSPIEICENEPVIGLDEPF